MVLPGGPQCKTRRETGDRVAFGAGTGYHVFRWTGQPVWKNGSYVTGGAESADYITFDVGSGDYRFKLTGTPGSPVEK